MIKAERTKKDSLDLQPTCNQLATTEGDLISRQAAIDAVNRAVTKEAARWSIQELPSAESKTGKWIPCSERLPKEFYVLCCDNHREMLIANPFECGDSDTGFSAESEDCYMYNCVAWMPLPEPYKEDE